MTQHRAALCGRCFQEKSTALCVRFTESLYSTWTRISSACRCLVPYCARTANGSRIPQPSLRRMRQRRRPGASNHPRPGGPDSSRAVVASGRLCGAVSSLTRLASGTTKIATATPERREFPWQPRLYEEDISLPADQSDRTGDLPEVDVATSALSPTATAKPSPAAPALSGFIQTWAEQRPMLAKQVHDTGIE